MDKFYPILIDDLILRQHYDLFINDIKTCYYVMTYASGQGYQYSEENRLVSNFKKKPSQKGRNGYFYKDQSIAIFTEILNDCLFSWIDTNRTIFVPIPPSKCKSHEDYDDRVEVVLRNACLKNNGDYREIITTSIDLPASHESENRSTIEELVGSYLVNTSLVSNGDKNQIVLFDDVVTNGRHFLAAKQVLEPYFPGFIFIGFFIARRKPVENL